MKTAPRTVLISHHSRIFAAIALIFAATICLTNSSGVAGEGLSSEPYTVFVAYDKAFARCGPSSDYYRTDPLRHGQKLEVYVETDDGWLGVRPPEESFCWVPASTIKTSNRGQDGEVIEDRTVAWIGTNLGRAKRYRWQVQLAEGEPVTIIGRSEREGPDGPQLWYRIVPPSGEFRWIHRDQIVGTAEELVAKAAGETNDMVADSAPPRGTKPSISRFGNLADRGKSILAKAIPDAVGKDEAPRVAKITPAPTEPGMELEVAASLPSNRRANDPLFVDAEGASAASQASSRRTKPMPQSTALNQLQRVPAAGTPQLSSAPQPRSAQTTSRATKNAATSLHAQTSPSQTVGSGLNQQWQNQPASAQPASAQPASALPAPVRSEPQLATADFVSRPRLIDIGGTAAPDSGTIANDSNWTVGAARQAGHNGAASQSQLAMAGQPSTFNHPPMPLPAQAMLAEPTTNPAPKVVSQAAIDSIAAEARNADVEQLHLMLSRLMASSATAVETQPISDAAQQLAASANDGLVSARAALLSERVAQYQRVAVRRDGQAVIRADLSGASNGYNGLATDEFRSSVIPASAAMPVQPSGIQQLALPTPPPESTARQLMPSTTQPAPATSGYLVQVYSARQNSPPYALTDTVGNTIAYVTPAPGVSLRHHINSEVSVAGNQGYVQGLNTPHIIANEAVRVASDEIQNRR